MPFRFAAAIALILGFAVPASAAEARECYGKAETQALAASGRIVPLADAIKSARLRRTDVVRARLCKGPKGYVYVLTLLARDGKVTHATVDASNQGSSAS